MKKITLLLTMAAIVISSCSKFETEDLVGTYWTGSMTSTAIQSGEKTDLSFEFKEGKADFTYLPYGDQPPETGVMLYTLSEGVLTLTKANEVLNGAWNIIYRKGGHMTLEKSSQDDILTINIQKRR